VREADIVKELYTGVKVMIQRDMELIPPDKEMKVGP
jgi:hypothetical protein